MVMSVIVGFLAGVTTAMGLGGGFILMIYLTTFLNINQIFSQMLNLIFYIPIASVSIILHIKNRLIDFNILLFFVIFGLIGVVLGSLFTCIVPTAILRKLFAAMLLLFGVKELIF